MPLLMVGVMERRHFHRLIFAAEAQLCQANKSWQTRVLDLSLQGSLLTKPQVFDANTRQPMQLIINLQDLAQPIIMQVKCVHSGEQKLGLQITKVDIDSMTELRRLVELNTGNDDILHRELAQMIG